MNSKLTMVFMCVATSIAMVGCGKKPAEEMRDFLSQDVKLNSQDVQLLVSEFSKLDEQAQEKNLAGLKASFAMDKSKVIAGITKDLAKKHEASENAFVKECLEQVTLCTKCPDLERKYYEKVIRSSLANARKCASGSLSESEMREAVKRGIEQSEPIMKQMATLDANSVRQGLETSINMMR